MSTIMIAWELGAGWGHVARLRPIARQLQQRGHQVVIALRDVAATGSLFTRFGIPCLAAPFKLGWPKISIRPAVGFAHVLHNVGFADPDELGSLVGAWHALFDMIDPDVILFDHSPTALLAARGHRAARVVVGDGFCCPPANDFLPVLTPWRDVDLGKLHQDELRTLGIANQVLAAANISPLRRLSDIYHDDASRLFTTLAEMDHFGPRRSEQYFGPTAESLSDAALDWPPGKGPRALAYLRPFSQLPELLRLLDKRGVSTLLYCPGASPSCVPAGSSIRFVDQPFDLNHAARRADLAILNGSHGTTMEMLLAGVPVLQIPLHMEQQLVAHRSVRLGAGLAVSSTTAGHLETQLERLLADAAFRSTAEQFASRYRNLNSQASLGRMVDEIEQCSAIAV